MSEENVKKKVDFKVEDGKFMLLVDLNADGEALLKVEIDTSEMADEILDLFKK